MKVEIECLYCGHRWVETIYGRESLVGKVCTKCKSQDLKAKDATSKIDYYKGAPEFVKPKKKTYNSDW